MKPDPLQIVADYQCHCGENPMWHPDEQRFYWTDIPTGRLFRLDPVTGRHEQCYQGRPVGGFTIQADGSLLLFMDKGTVAVFQGDRITRTVIEEIPDETKTRFNDVIAERFAQLAHHLHTVHGLTVLLNGSPGERDLLEDIAARAGALDATAATAQCRPVVLPAHGGTLGSLKAMLRDARLLVTNDTGPRHIAIALGTPTVSLFGPTDARWTTVPTHADTGAGTGADTVQGTEIILIADPDLPPGVIANDVPDRCRIDAIDCATVRAACDQLLARSGSTR